MAHAARYGHQPLETIRAMTSDELEQFNAALGFWVEQENQSGKLRGNDPSGG